MGWKDIVKEKDEYNELSKDARYERYMFMRTPQEALDVIANLIASEAPLKEQDAWLKACIELELVEVDYNE